MVKADCTSIVSHSKIKVEENKRKAVFLNAEKASYSISRIDNCVVTKGPRADFLVSKAKSHSALVELKGTDVEHACEQLFTSAEHVDVKILLNKAFGFLVVCSRYPKFDTFVLRAKQKAATRYRAGFHIVQGQGEFDITRIADIRDM